MKCLLVTWWHLGSPLTPSSLLPPSPPRVSRLSRRSCSLCHSTAPCSGSFQRSVRRHRGISEGPTSTMQELCPVPRSPTPHKHSHARDKGRDAASSLLFWPVVGQFETRWCSLLSRWQQRWYAASCQLRSNSFGIPPAWQLSLGAGTGLPAHATDRSLGSKPTVAKKANPFPLQTPATKHGGLRHERFWRQRGGSMVLFPSGWGCRCSCFTVLAGRLP